MAILLFSVGLGNHGLLEPDEGRYANMAVEWLEFDTHDWLEPVLSDVGHFDKPPLIYWLTGGNILLFGQSEWAARMPSVLGGLLTLIGVGLMAGQVGGKKAAWWAVLVTLTSYQFWALSHLLSPDMLLCGFVTLGTALIFRSRTKGGWFLWFCGALLWVLAWWTKATASLVPLGALTLALLITGKKDLLHQLKPVRLLCFILLLGLPWYLAMILRHPELKDFFLHRELAGRITGHPDKRLGFLGYHFAVAAGFWLPWWPVLLQRCWPAKSQCDRVPWREKLRSLPWEPVAALGVILIFSFVSSKLVTYILPGLPFLTVRIGILMAAAEPGFSLRRWPAYLAGATAILLCAAGFSVPRFENSLGWNSSVRQAVTVAKENGARRIICDQFWPGVEFYFGDSVWYVDAKNPVQAEGVKGQQPSLHFVSGGEIRQRTEASPGPVWLLQFTGRSYQPRAWERELIEKARSRKSVQSVSVGEFTLWRIK